MKKDNNKFKELLRVVKFTIISISAGIIQIALFALFNEVFSWDHTVYDLLSLAYYKETFKNINKVLEISNDERFVRNKNIKKKLK